MVDDDVYACYALVSTYKRRITNPRDVRQVIETTALCARAAGARIFGFNQAWDVRKFLPQKPVSLTGWVGGAIGIVGRERLYDPQLLLRADIDACLTSLLRHRIIYQDLRFSFPHHRFAGTGGNAVCRSEAQHAREITYLQRKWGAHLHIRRTKTTVRLVVDVPRTQPT
jgi:hypothetical protein